MLTRLEAPIKYRPQLQSLPMNVEIELGIPTHFYWWVNFLLVWIKLRTASMNRNKILVHQGLVLV